MHPIYLIGYMGCGKTTLGRAVAHAASMRFIDLDEMIEQEQGMTVSEIFAARGEEVFRQLEREALRRVSTLSDVIIATGGGTPCREGMMELMLATGTPVYLTTGIDRLHSRLAVARATRPLIARLNDDELREFITRSLENRQPHYSRAKAQFDSTRLEDAGQIAATTQLFINQFIINDR